MTHPGAARMGELGKEGLQAAVGKMCDDLGLYHYHVRDSRGATRKGFPDSWIMNMRTGQVIYRELKTQSGRLTSEQRAMGYALMAGGHSWEVWRPADLYDGTIGAQLAALAGHRTRIEPKVSDGGIPLGQLGWTG